MSAQWFFPSRFVGAIALAACLWLPQGAAAQGGPEAERQAVFAELLAAPADRELMLEYARLSVQVRDYEAAAATLERFVDLEPGNVGARVELAVAYFALGAFEIAEFHLTAVADTAQLTQEQVDRIARYQDEAQSRSRPNQISGFIAIGEAQAQETGGSGPFITGGLEWRLDIGDANSTQWVTELGFSSFQPGSQTFVDREILRVRSGPEFRATALPFEPRIQPYIELMTFRDDTVGFGDFNAVALGLAVQNTHSAAWSSFADVQIGEATSQEPLSDDFSFRELTLGATYRPFRTTRLRASGEWREEEDTFNIVTTRRARIEALQRFSVGLFATPRRWEARGFYEYSETEEDFSGFFSVETTDRIFGGGLRAFVTEELFLEARGTRFERDIAGFFPQAQEETVYSLQVGWEF